MKSPDPTPQKRSFWQYLVAPMLVISVGLHGALLLLPTGASDDELVPAPDPEEDGIAITRIDPPSNQTAGTQATGTQTAENRNSSAKTNPSSQSHSSPSSSNRASSSTSRGPSGSSSSASASGSRGNRPSSSSQSSTASRGNQTSDTAARDASTERNSSASNQDTSVGPQTAGPDPLVTFLDYFAVFETYRGPVPIEADEIQELKEIWLSELKESGIQLADIEAENVQPLAGLDKIPYPAAVCLPQAPATAQLLVLVDGEGSPNRDIFPIKDTGYISFDDQAAAVIRNHDFPKQDVPVAYLVDVEVDYDRDTCKWPPSIEGVDDGYWALLGSYVGPDLTTANDAQTEEERWRSQLSLPATTPLPDFEVTVNYGLELCLPIAPGPAQFGIVVQPDGNLQGVPALLRSTGYEFFDDQAEQLVGLIAFSGADTPQVHVLTVPVAYNPLLCESLSDEDN